MAFEINVVRHGKKGRLTFTHGDVAVDTDCWWDPDVVVVAGTYAGYATRMATKADGKTGKREAIWLGKHVPVDRGTRTANDIFIHKGRNASWSDGCIVAAENEVLKIWNAVSPKEQPNVTVVIADKPA